MDSIAESTQLKIKLALLQLQSGNFDVAADMLDEVLQVAPEEPDALNLRGVVYDLAGKPGDAVAFITRALAVRPNHPESWNNLGLAQQSLQAGDLAETAFRTALTHQPDYVEAAFNLARTLFAAGKYGEAENWAKRVIHTAPQVPEAHTIMGNIKEALKEPEAAIACFEKALSLGYRRADAQVKLAELYQSGNQLVKAEAQYRQALTVTPQDAEIWHKLGIVLLGCGKTSDAVTAFETALVHRPDYTTAHSYLLLALHYLPDISAQEISERTKAWAAPYNRNFSQTPTAAMDANKILRVGFISCDLRNHPVGTFLFPLLVSSDAARIEFYLYYNNETEDWMSETLKKSARIWRNVAPLTDTQLADQIRADRIDILIDLNGHTPRHRLTMMAQKPAPMQATWLGYFNTTGLESVDYILCDDVVLPAKDETLYSEKPLRLPDSYLCYAAPDFDLKVTPLPAAKNGFITFGSFNYRTKITDEVVRCWMEILAKVPGSQLYVRNPSFADDTLKDEFLAVCRKYGDAARVKLEKGGPQKEFMASYQNVDIALDPFPYGGGTTTVESLWMGVPVITLSGEKFVSRISHTLLQQVGRKECIAANKDAYIAAAVALAGDVDALAKIRAGLRKDLMESRLCDAARFAQNFESALRGAWGQVCEQKKAA